MHAVSSPKNGWHLSATKLIWMWCNGHNCFLEKSHLCDSVLEPKLYAQSFLRASIHQIPFAYFPENAVSQEEDSAFLFGVSIGSHKKVQKMTEKTDFLLLESCGYRIFQKKKIYVHIVSIECPPQFSQLSICVIEIISLRDSRGLVFPVSCILQLLHLWFIVFSI